MAEAGAGADIKDEGGDGAENNNFCNSNRYVPADV